MNGGIGWWGFAREKGFDNGFNRNVGDFVWIVGWAAKTFDYWLRTPAKIQRDVTSGIT